MTNAIGFELWLDMIHKVPKWELAAGGSFFLLTVSAVAIYQFLKLYQLPLFHAFEHIKIKRKDLDQAVGDAMQIEITIPKNSQVTAFQVQQKILKALHAVYQDPIEGPHAFSRHFYFFQKLWRLWKVYRAKQIFFTLQIWAQYPYISFRLSLPKVYFDRIEKAVFNAYPNAEITIINQNILFQDVSKHQKSYLSYGQSSIEGPFYHRVKTLKDVSSDPVDSIISTMEGLPKGQFMVYNILLSPTSHFFNQIIYFLLEEQERLQALPEDKKKFPALSRVYVSELMSLSVKEARAITAADFSKDALVEIVNPDLHIATLTESSGSFDMEVWIGKGRGYRPTEERLKEKLELGTIAVDALYSPVVNVSYKVEATRVGDKTDYDKLVLKIETDGSLDPIDAVNQGVGILNDYVNVLKDVSYTEAT